MLLLTPTATEEQPGSTSLCNCIRQATGLGKYGGTLDLLTYLMLARRDPGLTVACTLRSGGPLAKASPVRQWVDRVLTGPRGCRRKRRPAEQV